MSHIFRARDESPEAVTAKRSCPSNSLLLSTVKNLIVKLSEQDASLVNGRIEDLSSFVMDLWHKLKEHIIQTMVDCVVAHPLQCGTYATFVGMVNARNFQFGGEFVTGVVQLFQKMLDESEWQMALSIFKLLAEMVNANVLSIGSVMKFLLELTDESLSSRDSPNSQRDFFIHMVLSVLPVLGLELYEKRESLLNQMLDDIGKYMKRRGDVEMFGLLRVFGTDEIPQYESLDLQWQWMVQLKTAHFLEEQPVRPYEAFDDALSPALQHELPRIILHPCNQSKQTVYPQPWLSCHLFERAIIWPSMPDVISLDRRIMETNIRQILKSHHLERKICAQQLVNYYSSWPNAPVDYCIVEILLSEMLRLPNSEYLNINYSTIIIELCKLLPDIFPKAVSNAVAIMFNQLDSMNVSSFDRFVIWFSHHLANFRFVWMWEIWESCLKLPELHPSPMFVRELLEKCMRLSYYQYVVQMVPASFAPLLPPSPDPNFKYLYNLLPGAQLANQLLTEVRSKGSPLIIGQLLEAPSALTMEQRINVLIQTLLHVGSKSFTHIFGLLRKYEDVIKELANSPANQLAIVQAVFEIWDSSNKHKVVICQTLVKMQIINSIELINFLFTLKSEVTSIYIWELIASVLQIAKRSSLNIFASGQAPFGELILHVIQSCIRIMTVHENLMLSKGDRDFWTDWLLGRLQGILFAYKDDVRRLHGELHQILSETDECKRLIKMIQSYLAYIEY